MNLSPNLGQVEYDLLYPLSTNNSHIFLEHRAQVLKYVKKKIPNSIIFLKGSSGRKTLAIGSKIHFCQEPNFFWLFGVNRPDYYGAIDVPKGKSYLFYPTFGQSVEKTESFKSRYGVDFIYPHIEMVEVLGRLGREVLLVYECEDKYLFTTFSMRGLFKIDTNSIRPILEYCRAFKTEDEIALIRKLIKITGEAHRWVLKVAKHGMAGYEMESKFNMYAQYSGGLNISKIPLCTTVKRITADSVKINYANPNQETIDKGEMCYFEGGVTFEGFTVDLTTTFPISEKFNEIQRNLHELVLRVRAKVIESFKSETNFWAIENAAETALLNELISTELLTFSIQKAERKQLSKLFLYKPTIQVMGLSKNETHSIQKIIKPGMILIFTSQCFFMFNVSGANETEYFLSTTAMNYLGHGSLVQDIILTKQDGYEVLSDLPMTPESIEAAKEPSLELEETNKEKDLGLFLAF